MREFSTSCCKKVQGMDIPKVALSVKRFLKQYVNSLVVDCCCTKCLCKVFKWK